MSNTYIKHFKQISFKDLPQVGGKAASLGEILQQKFPVPDGFVITTRAHKNFNKQITPSIKKAILHAFEKLNVDSVAVRSSSVTEDSLQASWAGQLESYLYVDKEHLIGAIHKCWESIHATKAITYAKQHEIPESKLAIAVIVQKMVKSDFAGVMFTVNPVTNNYKSIVIESCIGLGELLVQGEVTPDEYGIDKQTLQLRTFKQGNQRFMLRHEKGKTVKVPISHALLRKRVLQENLIKRLAAMGKNIEAYYHFPQDIEWAIENEKIYIVQSRPITTLRNEK